jgi:putative hydrolase of HD superfamily
MQDLEELVDFFIETESLKKTFRFSTCPENVRDTSADHSWKLAFMSFLLDEEIKGVNSYHAIQICLVHDLAEAITGDVDAYRIVLGEITKEQKHKMEEEAMRGIKERVHSIGPRIYTLWKEFEDCKTPEAKYAKAMDKIEGLIHLIHVNYIAEKDDAGAELTAKYADNAVKEFPQLQPFLNAAKLKLKKEFEKQGFQWKPDYD